MKWCVLNQHFYIQREKCHFQRTCVQNVLTCLTFCGSVTEHLWCIKGRLCIAWESSKCPPGLSVRFKACAVFMPTVSRMFSGDLHGMPAWWQHLSPVPPRLCLSHTGADLLPTLWGGRQPGAGSHRRQARRDVYYANSDHAPKQDGSFAEGVGCKPAVRWHVYLPGFVLTRTPALRRWWFSVEKCITWSATVFTWFGMVWLIFTYLKDPDLLWCRYKFMNYQHLTVVFLALRYSVDNVTVF